MKKIHLLLVSLSFATAGFSQSPGSLDFSFGTSGKTSNGLFYPSLNERDEIHSIALQSDGKIVAAGVSNNGSNNDFSLARYNANGTLDNTFGATGNGTVATAMNFGADEAEGVALQSDGKIVVVGYANSSVTFYRGFGIARYTTAGILDNTFNTNGKVIATVPTFTADAMATCVAIQSDGKIVVGGYAENLSLNNDIVVMRFNTNGTLDNTFGVNGILTQSVGASHDQINCILLQPDGKILAAGFTQSTSSLSTKDAFIVRYNTNGTLDNTFGFAGAGTATGFGSFEDEIFGMALQSDGNIVVTGLARNTIDYDIAVARFTAVGLLDLPFNGTGKVISPAGSGTGYTDVGRAIAVQADGQIVIAGFGTTSNNNEDFVLQRFNPNGSLDNTFGLGGVTLTPFITGARKDVARAMVIQPNGKIVVGGYMENATDYDYALARYNGSPTTINELSFVNSVSIYPNPFTESVSINYTLQNEETVSISLTDVQGRELKVLSDKKMDAGVNTQTFDLPIELSAGLYFISMKSEYQHANYKLIKQ